MADRALILDLLEYALKGQSLEALNIMEDLYKKGADPVVVIQDMLDLSHLLTKHRALPKGHEKGLIAKGEQERLENLADSLSMPTLAKTWQILLKGLGEVNTAPNAQKAAEMIVMRLIYAADLPDPADLIKRLKNSSDMATPSSGAQASQNLNVNEVGGNATINNNDKASSSLSQASPAAAVQTKASYDENTSTSIQTMQDVVALLEQNKEMILASHITMYAHPVKISEGVIEFRPTEDAPERLSQELSRALKAITNNRWIITISSKVGEPTLAQLADKADADLRQSILTQPLVKNILEFFPDATLKEITKK
jgi:DNA polymerase-3 subunit gamma/tau